MARTILQNAKYNEEYLVGADIQIREHWVDNSGSMSSSSSSGATKLTYMEPDYGKFSNIPGVKSFTKVIYDEKATTTVAPQVYAPSILMGIHTKEFGEITNISNDLLEKPYYEYLNELALEPKGILLSRNFQTIYNIKIGDNLDYKDGDGNTAIGKVVDFVDYWPGYSPTSVSLKADESVEIKDNFLVIANIANLQTRWGITPYEVWISMQDNTDTDGVYQWIEDNNISVKRFVDREVQLVNVEEDPLLQGTNGVLTMGFIVTIILCGVGYLIYWIMSIRSREMLFGVLRACGMHKKELFHMLINEQIFSGVLSIIAGIGIGTLTSKMFVPMLQTAYAASNQVLPMELITNPNDMIRLYSVVALVMAVCLSTLILLVFKLNVTKALKLGEE